MLRWNFYFCGLLYLKFWGVFVVLRASEASWDASIHSFSSISMHFDEKMNLALFRRV